MIEPENTEEERQRKLKELEGKNISHYSVMLSAYISSRTEPNKAIFTFSSVAIGLLLASPELAKSSCTISTLYALATLTFVIAVISTLFIYISNTRSIEAYIRGEEENKKNFHLQTWMYINYIAFGLGIAFSSAMAIFNIYA